MIVTELEHSSNYFPWKNQCEKNARNSDGIGTDRRQPEGGGCAGSDGQPHQTDCRHGHVQRDRLLPGRGPYYKRSPQTGRVLVLIDAAQAVVHRAISVRQMKCDFLASPATRYTALWESGYCMEERCIWRRWLLYLYGGDMVVKGDRGEVSYKKSPSKYEAGTQDIAGALGLEAALSISIAGDLRR